MGARQVHEETGSISGRLPNRRDLFHAVVSAVAIAFLSWGAVAFTPTWGTTALWWPAAGASVAAVITARGPMRPWIVLLVLVVSAGGNIVGGREVVLALAFGAANAAEAAVAAWWLTRGTSGIPRLMTLADLWRLVVAAVFGSLVIALGATSAVVFLADGSVWPTFLQLMASHASAIIIITPLVMRQANVSGPSPLVERIAQVVVAIGLLAAIFGPASSLPISFLVAIPLFWAALRMDLRWVTIQSIVVLGGVIFLTGRGFGPFAEAQLRIDSVPYLAFMLTQLFVITAFLMVESLALVVSSQRRLLGRVTDSERLLRAGFNDSLLGTAIVRRQRETFRLVEVNRVAQDLLRLPPMIDDLESVDWLARVARDRPAVEAALRAVEGGDVASWRAEIELDGGPSGRRWIEAAAAPLTSSDHLLVMHLVDVTARKRAESALEQLALYDPTTGLPNRTLLQDRLDQALVLHEVDGVTVLFLDIDDFKRINDTVGHLVGDHVLAAIADRLRSGVRDLDTVARLGGDEFVIVLPGVGEPQAPPYVDAVLELLREPLVVEGASYRVSASLGVVTSRPGSTAVELLRDADTAMYVSKGSGRARATQFDEQYRERAMAAARITAELDGALERREICMYVQPIVSLTTGEIVAGEALVRWQHPSRGLLLPAEWLDVANQGALGQRLERWILDECFGIAGQWHMRWGNDAPPLHVNISTGLLHRGDLNQQVSSALHVASIPARSIILELTEHDLEAVRPSLSAELASLKQMGIRLAVDDFGTGYSAFSRLSELPLDELKIDYSFTSRMLHDERSRAVVTAVLRLAQSLGLATVAEGVESLDQVEFLLDNGCDYGQGFLWGRGVPVEEFADNYAQQHESASGTVGR